MVEYDFFVPFNVKYPYTKLNSSRDFLNCMRKNYQFSFLSNFGKVVFILSIIPLTSCCAGRSSSVLQKLKTYLKSTRDQDCRSHPALLHIERFYSNRIRHGKKWLMSWIKETLFQVLSNFYLFWISWKKNYWILRLSKSILALATNKKFQLKLLFVSIVNCCLSACR